EPFTTTDASGNWSFTNLKPGSYSVREEPGAGFLCSAPSTTFANCEFNQTVTSNQTDGGHAFGNFQPVSISGNKFRDANANGTDDGDAGVNGVTIYLDGSGATAANGTLDADEISTTTA